MIINAVPLLPGYRWHRTARIWRTPVLGELAMGTTNRFTLRLLSRESNAHAAARCRRSGCDSVLDHFDQGTQRAILRLYRSSPPATLAAAGSAAGRADVPALVAWGDARPLHPGALRARDYARRAPRRASCSSSPTPATGRGSTGPT